MKKRRLHTKHRRIPAFLLAMIAAVSLIGCSGQGEAQKPSVNPETKSEAFTVTDLDGQTYRFDRPIQKAIVAWSGGGGPFFVIAGLFGDDLPDALANLDSSLSVNRYDMYEHFTGEMPRLKELADFGEINGGTFDVEAAIASGADVMILPLGLKPAAQEGIQKQLEAADIPVIYIDFHAETPERHAQSVELIGKLYGREERAREMIDFYMAHVEPLYERVEKLLAENERPLVHVEVGMNGPDAPPKGFSNTYSWGKMIYDMGGTCTGEGIVNNQEDMDPEALISMDPDKIFLAGAYWPSSPDSIRSGYLSSEDETRGLVKNYLTRTGWSELSAVKNGEVYIIPHAIARDIYDCASYEALARFIWPEEFADLDPSATLKAFFDEFLPFSYGGNWYMEYGS